VLPADSRFAVYVGKFCFDFKKGPDAEAGLFEFKLHGRILTGSHELSPGLPQVLDGPPQTEGNLYLFVFDDEADHWKRAHEHWSTIDCEEMMKYQSFAVPLPHLNGAYNRTIYVHEKIRPRFWYFTFAACGITVMEPVHFEIHASNIQQGLQSEFGIDERGSLQLQILATGMFLTVCLSLRRVAKRSTGAEALRSRPLLRVLIVSSLCSSVGAISLTLHYLVFMFDGYGLSWLKVQGDFWVACSKALLTLLQLLTAKGWALFYAPEELVQRRLMICLLGGIVLISMACEIHAEFAHDWSTTIYLYESYPGLVILFLNVVLFTEAWRSMRETYRHESSEEVRVFYVIISAASLLYFLTLPVMCMLAAAFNPWVRAKYVDRAEVASRFVSTALLAFCLRPSRLDAMVNARLEDGLETIGELREDLDEPSDAGYCQAVEDEDRTERSEAAEPLQRAGPAE